MNAGAVSTRPSPCWPTKTACLESQMPSCWTGGDDGHPVLPNDLPPVPDRLQQLPDIWAVKKSEKRCEWVQPRHVTINSENRVQLYQQLKLVLWLLSNSKREIVQSITLIHLKNILALKHHLISVRELQSLLSELDMGFGSNLHSVSRFVVQSFLQIQSICAVLGWTESDDFSKRYTEMIKDAESPRPFVYSMPSILALLKEINPELSVIKHFSKHRKTAVQFRDKNLKEIIVAAFKSFRSSLMSPNQNTETALAVVSKCLFFDFLGTMGDQDDHGLTSAIQLPDSLKSWVLEEKPHDVLLEAIDIFPASKHVELLEAIGAILGCRRSLFLEEERGVFFDRACLILARLLSLSLEEEAFLELIKTCLRFCCVYSMDMKKGQNSRIFFEALLTFTGIHLYELSPTSYLHVVQCWVMTRDSENTFFVERLEAFKAMLVSLVSLSAEMLERLYFEDENSVEQVISPLGKLLRQSGTEFTASMVIGRLQRYGKETTGLAFAEVAWTLSLFAQTISHRIAYQAETKDDIFDGRAASAVFNYAVSKQPQTDPSNKCEEQLEIAILFFFEQFKQVFMTGDGSGCPEMWKELQKGSQIASQEHVLEILLQRSLYYLKNQISEALILKSVVVIKELVNGVRTLKLMQKPEVLGYIESSGILGFHFATTYQKSKCLTVLFEHLGRLFMNDIYQGNNLPEKNLLKLLNPISYYLTEFVNGLNDGADMDVVVRKLRGILTAIYSCKLVTIFYNWLKPHIPAFSLFISSPRAVNGPQTTLKLFRDLLSNKVNRLNFDSSPEYGILIFKDCMSIMLPVAFKLQQTLSSPELSEAIWVQQCLKPICILLDAFKNCIHSRSVPFGIMQLYEDPSLQDLIKSIYMVSLSVGPSQIMQFTKLGTSFFNLWVCMTSDYHPYLLKDMNDELLAHLGLNCLTVLREKDDQTSSQACTLISSIYTEMNATKLLYNATAHDLHKSLIPLLLSRVLSDASLETQWSFTRPIFPLIAFDFDWFRAYLEHLSQSQPPTPNLAALQKILVSLLSGIEDQMLNVKNRDRMTMNLESAKRSLRSENLTLFFG